MIFITEALRLFVFFLNRLVNMGNNVSFVRRRAFNRRSGYSKAPFHGRSKDDLESDQADLDTAASAPEPKPITKKYRTRRRLVGWRYKKSSEIATNARSNEETNGKVKAAMANVDAPAVVETTAGSDRNCSCQGKGCVDCDVVEILPPSGRMKRKRLVNVNTCNVSDLMALDGVDQSIATNIVIYREKRGRFKQLDKLLKVPGLTKSIYCRIAPYVTVVSMDDDDSSGLHINEGAVFDSNNVGGNLLPRHSKDNKGHSRQSSAVSSHKSSAANDCLDMLLRIPVDTEGGKDLEQANIELIYRLMCSKSERPKANKTDFEKESGCGSGNATSSEQQQQLSSYDFTRLRLGCWDFEGCSFEKAHNPGVLEVICMTILENRLNNVALTNFTSDHVLDRLVTELNFPTLHKVKLWRQACQSAPRFDCASFYCSESNSHYGFLFVVPFMTLERTATMDAIFKIGTTSVTFRKGFEDESNVDKINSLDEDVVYIEKCANEKTSASGNLLYFGQYALRWSDSLSSRFAGRAGIIEDGLTHLAIPNGWTLGGRVTKSNPIWVHFSLNDSQSNK